MKYKRFRAADVVGAREEIFNLIQSNLNNNIIIYFDGWRGFGAAAVLRSITQALPTMKDPPPKLCFSRTIYIDCSRWTSKRMMQRKIADELKLDRKTMAMFDEQDEEDDFNGVDHGSRDAIRSVTSVIDSTLRESRFMMIFINGSDDELDLSRLGVPQYLDCVVVWTFNTRRFMMMDDFSRSKIGEKLRYTDVFLYSYNARNLSSSQFMALFHEEAANIVARYTCMCGMYLTTVVDCSLYGLLMYHSSRGTTGGFAWPAHAPNYWICDGIIQGDRAWEISNALHPEISFECDVSVLNGVFRELKKDPKTPFLVVKDDDDVYEERPYYRWISITLKNKKVHEGMQTIFERASSIFLAFETKDRPGRLPNGLFKQCNNLGVLALSCCAFSFVSPPFLHCHALRFLGLEDCKDENSIEVQGGGCTTKWTFLNGLWIIDLCYTDWVEILSEKKIELMDNLMVLNIKGVRWPRWTCQQLQKKLPYLQQLRIISPICDEAETMSSDIRDSFLMENTSMEILDLSGCDGLEAVVLSSNTLLRSFSFDGYGPASHRRSNAEQPLEMSRLEHLPNTDKKGVIKTSTISLAGCTRLDNLFLRGLPNLEELDLSGCAVKVLDFGAMVVDVPRVKRLFLLGCENLRAIKWGSYEQRPKLLELICIDTRPVSGSVLGCAPPPSLGAQQKSFLQVHAIITDARLARSLSAPIDQASSYVYFNISITSSAAFSGVVQPEATASKEKMIGSGDQRHYAVAVAGLYGDTFTKVGDGLAPMKAFPQAPMRQLDRHIEIGDQSRNVQSEVELDPYGDNLGHLMSLPCIPNPCMFMMSRPAAIPCLHQIGLASGGAVSRLERCPNLHAVFPPNIEEYGWLETIWASDLLMARCVWSKGVVNEYDDRFVSLQHLHLRCCLSLQFALAMGSRPSFPSLETLHIIHCGDLRHVFVPGDEGNRHTSVQFPKLTTIHLYDLPALQQICDAAEMLAPVLETIKFRGCWSLRQLPALKGREPGMRRPTVEVEKDVWDALEWEGVDAGHHPSLYEAPVHSRYYKRRMLRSTVLR